MATCRAVVEKKAIQYIAGWIFIFDYQIHTCFPIVKREIVDYVHVCVFCACVYCRGFHNRCSCPATLDFAYVTKMLFLAHVLLERSDKEAKASSGKRRKRVSGEWSRETTESAELHRTGLLRNLN